MIRVSTIVWVGLAALVGFGLFQLKHEVQALEDELFRLNRTILAEQEAIHVLKAEWSYINQPQRLQSLSSRHLDLEPMKPAQLGTLDTLPMRGEADPLNAAVSPAGPGQIAPTAKPPAAPRPIGAAPPRPAGSAPRPATPLLATHPATQKRH